MAFKCKFGVFEYTTMPFGLKNASTVFQRMIDDTLGSLLGSCCIAYMDDILVFSLLEDQHKATWESYCWPLAHNTWYLSILSANL